MRFPIIPKQKIIFRYMILIFGLLAFGCEDTGLLSVQLAELDYVPHENTDNACPYSVKTPNVLFTGFSENKFYEEDATPRMVRVGFAGPTDTTFVVNWQTPGPKEDTFPVDEEGNIVFENIPLTLATEIIYGTDEAAVQAIVDGTAEVDNQITFQAIGHYMVLPFETSGRMSDGEEKGKGTLHEVHVCNLIPNTEYFYAVGGPEHWSSVSSTSTAPTQEQGQTQPWTLAVSGDTRGLSASEGGGEKPWAEINQQILHDHQADLHIFGGDAVQRGDQFIQWKFFLEFENEEGFNVQETFRKIPFMMAQGNHEARDIIYYALFGQVQVQRLEEDPSIPPDVLKETFFSFDYANAHFIFLTDYPRQNPALFSKNGAQYKWLESDLASVDRQKTPWVFLSTHIPFYTCQPAARQEEAREMRNAFLDLIDRYKIDIVFTGHNHEYSRTRPFVENMIDPRAVASNNSPKAKGAWIPAYDNLGRPSSTNYVVTAGAGASLYRTIDSSCNKNVVGVAEFNYLILKFEGTKLHFQAIHPNGVVLDQYCVVKSPSDVARGLSCLDVNF